MAKKTLKPLSVSVLLLVFGMSGCALRGDGRLGILSGALAWSRQDWAGSASAFLDSAERGGTESDRLLRDYAVYGLASTYLAQDEYDPALARLSAIRESESAEIRASVWYQAGVIAFRRGEYDEAFLCFHRSLENDPESIDAKINLELCRSSLVENEARQSGSSSGFSETGGTDQETDMIFNLVRKKEQDRWKSQENGSQNSAIADY